MKRTNVLVAATIKDRYISTMARGAEIAAILYIG